jgi:hypothetical protein
MPYRRIAARISELASLGERLHRTWKQRRDMHSIVCALASALPPNRHQPFWWIEWPGLVNNGLDDAYTWRLEAFASAAKWVASEFEAKLGKLRHQSFVREFLSCKSGPIVGVAVFRWLRDRSPFINSVVDGNGALCSYEETCDINFYRHLGDQG